jgi:predicted SAM-dependent methyltransferase
MWNLDSAFRYEDAVKIVRKIKPSVIVEVGSGSHRGISAYSKYPSFGVDIDFNTAVSPGIQRRIRASGTHLPFKNQSANLVISTDMLEHIPHEKRSNVISEMFRIAKEDGVLYITVPVGEDSEQADFRVNNAYLREHKKPHVMLRDHVEHKLPKAEEIIRLVKDEAAIRGWQVRHSENTPIWLWEMNLRIFAVERWIPGLRHFQRLILQWASPFLKKIRSDNNYRITVVASKNLSL